MPYPVCWLRILPGLPQHSSQGSFTALLASVLPRRNQLMVELDHPKKSDNKPEQRRQSEEIRQGDKQKDWERWINRRTEEETKRRNKGILVFFVIIQRKKWIIKNKGTDWTWRRVYNDRSADVCMLLRKRCCCFFLVSDLRTLLREKGVNAFMEDTCTKRKLPQQQWWGSRSFAREENHEREQIWKQKMGWLERLFPWLFQSCIVLPFFEHQQSDQSHQIDRMHQFLHTIWS